MFNYDIFGNVRKFSIENFSDAEITYYTETEKNDILVPPGKQLVQIEREIENSSWNWKVSSIEQKNYTQSIERNLYILNCGVLMNYSDTEYVPCRRLLDPAKRKY